MDSREEYELARHAHKKALALADAHARVLPVERMCALIEAQREFFRESALVRLVVCLPRPRPRPLA